MTTVLLAAAAALAMTAGAPAAGVDHGARVAQQRCAGCHAIGLERHSPNRSAPPFTDIRMRYNALSLERELAKISNRGHFEMRPQSIGSSEAEDLAAYIETLAPPVH
jgi:mono/diheme cytochrome c family protein